jgi:hypothetical protein
MGSIDGSTGIGIIGEPGSVITYPELGSKGYGSILTGSTV